MKNIKWNKLTTTQKHMVLMYMYRTETDLEHIEDYIETYYFRKIKLQLSDVPENILNMTPDQKRRLAYAVIGARVVF